MKQQNLDQNNNKQTTNMMDLPDEERIEKDSSDEAHAKISPNS